MKRKQVLQDLIKQLSPKLDSVSYVYCTVAHAKYGELEKLKPIVSIAELEGLTLVVPVEQAKAEGLDYYRVFNRITLEGHSSLEALGLTSVVASPRASRLEWPSSVIRLKTL